MNRRRRLLALLLAAVTAAAYAPGLDNDFLGDDLEWARFGLRILQEPGLVFSLFSGFVTPAMNVTVGLDARLGGTAPWIYNLTGLLFHVANVLLILRLLAAASGSRAAAWWAAAWWGLNYRHDEAVFWLGGRPHVMVITGILLSLLLQRRYQRTGSRLALAGCLAAGEIAILSKESGVMAAPLAALWAGLLERGGAPPEGAPAGGGAAAPGTRRWTPALGLLALAAVHAGVLWSVRGSHQNYYAFDWGWIGRLAAGHLEAAGLAVPDSPPAWIALPAALLWAALYRYGGGAARFGLLFMLAGTLPTVLIEHQPPRYRYFPLVGGAFALAAFLRVVIRRLPGRRGAAPHAAMALLCAHLAAGVVNDERYLDEGGRIHASLREAFCETAAGTAAGRPLAVVWRPSRRGVEALKAAANREVAWEARNFPPIFVRAGGLDGLAEPETLYALCPGWSFSGDVIRLSGAEAAGALEGEFFSVVSYVEGTFRRDAPDVRAILERTVRQDPDPPAVLPGGLRWAVLIRPGADRGSR